MVNSKTIPNLLILMVQIVITQIQNTRKLVINQCSYLYQTTVNPNPTVIVMGASNFSGKNKSNQSHKTEIEAKQLENNINNLKIGNIDENM